MAAPLRDDTTAVPRAAERLRTLALAGVLLLATLVVYAPACRFGFVNFDDPAYLAANPHVQRGLDADSVRWAFTTGRTANWIPLTWLSYLLDVELFGVDAPAHHAVNVALHAANVLLLLALLLRLGCGRGASFVVAALFALHPLRVESVAWVAERKDVLSALFALLSLHAWTSWTRRGGVLRWTAALLLFALGLMAKQMLVTLPFVLLLLDWWPLARTPWSPPSPLAAGARVRSPGRLLLEKLPFFALALVASAVTLAVQRAGGAVADPAVLPLATRVRGALAAYAWYLAKTVWPSGLAVLYPNPALLGGSVPTWQVLAGALLLAAVGVLALREARRRPWLLVGGAIFAGTLVPVVGLVQIGQQSTADRYTYLPSIGLAVLLAGLLAEAAQRLRLPRGARVAAVAVVLLVLAVATRRQVATWSGSVTLARRALAVTERNYVMHFNLALALDEQGDLAGAVRNYEEAAALRPDLASFRVNLGAALARAGRVDEAVAQYRSAMALDPRDATAFNNLAWLRATHPEAAHRDGREAVELARAALRRNPTDPGALDVLGAALAEQGRFGAAQRAAAGALTAARDAGRSDLEDPIRERLLLYRERRAYREAPFAAAAAGDGAAPLTGRSPAPRAAAPPRPAPPPATVR